ncbi:energy-coupling factor transport system substrate-specific component [Amphibacillus marinus]|uniref:Energy-coupling factor transport system substrate-specific component n=1 Tax=Amphibacillus marinus TaxID=872970 RepID=A0A1H8GCI7_9BACI|nr:ECF transporter S component [Amphibacillus marinus]SEN41703.1 energy-coupling factor transport system substrate-specific component [Amphibacillus marinus]
MRGNLYKLTLISVLAAICIVGRLAFQHLPNVQPVTAIIILSAYFLGPISGVMLAILTVYLTNITLGMGLWTIWQITAWSLIALLSAMLKKIPVIPPAYCLVPMAFGAGILYGFFFSVVNFVIAGRFWPYYLAGLPFDISHAVGNVIFIALLYRPLAKIFAQYHKKIKRLNNDRKWS